MKKFSLSLICLCLVFNSLSAQKVAIDPKTGREYTAANYEFDTYAKALNTNNKTLNAYCNDIIYTLEAKASEDKFAPLFSAAQQAEAILDQLQASITEYYAQLQKEIEYGSEREFMLKDQNAVHLNTEIVEVHNTLNGILTQLEKKHADKFDLSPTIISDFSKQLPIATLTNDAQWNSSKYTSWSNYYFEGKSNLEAQKELLKFRNNITNTKASYYRFLGNQTQGELNFNHLGVIANPQKSFVLLGETYEADIQLGAYTNQYNVNVSVGGRSLNVENGIGKYTVSTSSVGEKSYSARISITNPLTGETESFTKTFKYEVGQPSINISGAKMNVLYLGVENPIYITSSGLPSTHFEVILDNGKVTGSSEDLYFLEPEKPGNATITIQDTKNNRTFPFHFRVKRIPDPVIRLGRHTDGMMKAAQFSSQKGLSAWLDSFDFEAQCSVQSYTLHHYSDGKMTEIYGEGAAFKDDVLKAVQAAKTGDLFAFMDVKAKCPSDRAGRKVNGLVFRIK